VKVQLSIDLHKPCNQKYLPISISQAAVTKYHQVGNLKQKKFILKHLWELEVLSQGVSRVTLSLETLGKNPILPFSSLRGPQKLLPMVM
jgi:hypothetical protein